MWPVQLSSIIALALVADAAEVCYPDVGCFNNNSPYNNANGLLPLSPGQLPLNVLLYTRKNRANSISLQYNNPDVVKKLNDAQVILNKKTILIIHGFGGSTTSSPWMFKMKDEFLIKGDFNVFIVDWEKGAELPDYFQAAANVRVVGAQIQTLLATMQNGGLQLSNVHLIGHSLGCQLCGEIGRRMNGKLGRITGLDPAGPNFQGKSTDVKLDKSDAMFVDVIHTDGGSINLLTSGLGTTEATGHVDFYVNGGENQPGCYDDVLGTIGSWFGRKRGDAVIGFVSCSHSRARALFIESINSDCLFTAYPCPSYDDFEDGECDDCSNNGCNDMGYPASPSKGKGTLYLDTNSDSPYCEEDDDNSGSWFRKLFG